MKPKNTKGQDERNRSKTSSAGQKPPVKRRVNTMKGDEAGHMPVMKKKRNDVIDDDEEE